MCLSSSLIRSMSSSLSLCSSPMLSPSPFDLTASRCKAARSSAAHTSPALCSESIAAFASLAIDCALVLSSSIFSSRSSSGTASTCLSNARMPARAASIFLSAFSAA